MVYLVTRFFTRVSRENISRERDTSLCVIPECITSLCLFYQIPLNRKAIPLIRPFIHFFAFITLARNYW